MSMVVMRRRLKAMNRVNKNRSTRGVFLQIRYFCIKLYKYRQTFNGKNNSKEQWNYQ